MCWEGERNGSEDFEETWNGRMVINMEKLQWRIVVFKKKRIENDDHVCGL
jgi:hypothetical protein